MPSLTYTKMHSAAKDWVISYKCLLYDIPACSIPVYTSQAVTDGVQYTLVVLSLTPLHHQCTQYTGSDCYANP